MILPADRPLATRLDAGTPLYQALRAREIRAELADAERRQEHIGGAGFRRGTPSVTCLAGGPASPRGRPAA
jgi:hypothetical protein